MVHFLNWTIWLKVDCFLFFVGFTLDFVGESWIGGRVKLLFCWHDVGCGLDIFRRIFHRFCWYKAAIGFKIGRNWLFIFWIVWFGRKLIDFWFFVGFNLNFVGEGWVIGRVKLVFCRHDVFSGLGILRRSFGGAASIGGNEVLNFVDLEI